MGEGQTTFWPFGLVIRTPRLVANVLAVGPGLAAARVKAGKLLDSV
jgi:hypothetical protein